MPELRASSNGKGTSEIASVASAYAELAERLSAGMETGIDIGQFRQLYGEKGDLLSQITLYKYMDGYRWTHQDDLKHPVRAEDMLTDYRFTTAQYTHLKLNSELLRHWVSGYSLVHKKEVAVPILFVKWLSSTNGLASGNTIEEAIVHAACEIFERDALVRYLRRFDDSKFPTIDKSSINDYDIIEAINFFERNNVETVIKYIGRGIYPVFALMTFNHDLKPGHLGFNAIKAGASFSDIDAIKRCFTERMQGTTLQTEIGHGMANDEILKSPYLPIFFKGVCPMDISPFKGGEVSKFGNNMLNGTALEIEECVNIAKTLNTDMIVINHTHPVLNFPTVRVIMPGVSDFMKWWEYSKLNIDFIGNIDSNEDRYENTLVKMLKTFQNRQSTSISAQNIARRDT